MENASQGKIDRAATQAAWLNARMAGNPAWRVSMPPARQMVVSERRAFVVWKLENGRPHIIDILRADKVDVSFTAGLSLVLVSSTSGAPVIVSAYPREAVPGVFLWVPPFADVRFVPTVFQDPGSTWRLTVPMCVRPTGDKYQISTSKEFRDQWPDVTF